jgi:hypothetical protein
LAEGCPDRAVISALSEKIAIITGMEKFDRRAHDREAEATAGRRTWILVGIALAATVIVGWILLRFLQSR